MKKDICKVPDCIAQVAARGYCRKHYNKEYYKKLSTAYKQAKK